MSADTPPHPLENTQDSDGKISATPADKTTVAGVSMDADLEVDFSLRDGPIVGSVTFVRNKLRMSGFLDLESVRTHPLLHANVPEHQGQQYFETLIQDLLGAKVLPDALQTFATSETTGRLESVFDGDSLKGIVLRRLGQGAFADVRVVRQLLTDKDLVVKVLKVFSEEQAGSINERFAQEKMIVQMMEGYVFPQYVSRGIVDDGESSRSFYAMEYLDNAYTLLDVLKEKRQLPLRTVVDITLLSLLYSKALVDKAGATHRDIKPENMLITPDGTFKFLDPGIAKSTIFNANLTAQGGVIGTPYTISPESSGLLPDVYKTRKEEYTKHLKQYPYAGDYYSIAATAYWLATGRPMYEAKSENHAIEILSAHSGTATPDMRFFQQSGDHMDFGDFLEGILEKDMEQRVKNVDLERLFRLSSFHKQFEGDIEAFLASKPSKLPLIGVDVPQDHPADRGYRPSVSVEQIFEGMVKNAEAYVPPTAEQNRTYIMPAQVVQEDTPVDPNHAQTYIPPAPKSVPAVRPVESKKGVSRRAVIGAIGSTLALGTAAAVWKMFQNDDQKNFVLPEGATDYPNGTHVKLKNMSGEGKESLSLEFGDDSIVIQYLDSVKRISSIEFNTPSQDSVQIDSQHVQTTLFAGDTASALVREGLTKKEVERLMIEAGMSQASLASFPEYGATCTALHMDQGVLIFVEGVFYIYIDTVQKRVFTFSDSGACSKFLKETPLARILNNPPDAQKSTMFPQVSVHGQNREASDKWEQTELSPLLAGGQYDKLRVQLQHLR